MPIKVFPGLRKTNYDDGSIIRDTKYGRAFMNDMENHYISGYIVKNINGAFWGGGGNDISWAEGAYFDNRCKILDSPVFRVNDLLRYSPVLLCFKKEKLPKREGGKVIYCLTILYANKNLDRDSALEADFTMMVKYRFGYHHTLKNKPVKANPYEIIGKSANITRTEGYAWSADHFNQDLVIRDEY